MEDKELLNTLKEYVKALEEFGVSFLTLPDEIEFAKNNNKSIITEENDKTLKKKINRMEGDKSKKELLNNLRNKLGNCKRCKLHKERNNIVFGEGNPNAKLMFIGEGPGRDEDIQGRPFVGRAGKLLDKMIMAMGLKREDVYIANVVKCRPPNNRNPEEDEVAICSPFLIKQIEIINPTVIISLGAVSAQFLLNTKVNITRLRGNIHRFKNSNLVATYHPAYLLRNPSKKKNAWEDLKIAMKLLGLPIPGKK